MLNFFCVWGGGGEGFSSNVQERISEDMVFRYMYIKVVICDIGGATSI